MITNKAGPESLEPVEHVSQCLATSTSIEHLNQCAVGALYDALACGDTGAAAGLLVPELEWRFHGPPRCQHMMRVLTGAAGHGDHFRFLPKGITAVGGGWVVVEGWEGEHAYWVHVWKLEQGLITQFREYFNTCIVVRELGPPAPPGWEARGRRRRNRTVWQSRSGEKERPSRSLPGLVLAL